MNTKTFNLVNNEDIISTIVQNNCDFLENEYNESMIIYHGSKEVISSPIVKGSNPNNDYGPSFYMTLDLESAKEWACKNDAIGVANKYYVRLSSFKSLKILDLTDKNKYSVLNWLAILVHFRSLTDAFINKNRLAINWLSKYYIDVDQYDVVIGYRADDAYFKFPMSFISNDLAIEDLEETYMLGNLGVQFAFMSKRALSMLKYSDSIPCEKEYVGKYRDNVIVATQEFNKMLDKPRDINKTYIFDLIRRDNEN